MKLKESLEEYLDSVNYLIGMYETTLQFSTLSPKMIALKFVSKELGLLLDNFFHLGVTDNDRAERICHYLQIRDFTVDESKILKMKIRNEITKLHKFISEWEEKE